MQAGSTDEASRGREGALLMGEQRARVEGHKRGSDRSVGRAVGLGKRSLVAGIVRRGLIIGVMSCAGAVGVLRAWRPALDRGRGA